MYSFQLYSAVAMEMIQKRFLPKMASIHPSGSDVPIKLVPPLCRAERRGHVRQTQIKESGAHLYNPIRFPAAANDEVIKPDVVSANGDTRLLMVQLCTQIQVVGRQNTEVERKNHFLHYRMLILKIH